MCRQLPFGDAQHMPEVFLQPHKLGGKVKLLLRNLIRGFDFYFCHVCSIRAMLPVFRSSHPAPVRDSLAPWSLSSTAPPENSTLELCPRGSSQPLSDCSR